MIGRRLVRMILGLSCAVTLGLSPTAPAAGAPPAREGPVTKSSPVSGLSWVHHLRVDLEKTSLGGTGGWGGAAPVAATGSLPARGSLDGPILLTGRDIYRLSCQSCHREDGSGAPPEILPVTALARATSRQFFRDKMKERGLPVDEAQLAQNASQAETSLRNRILKGGEKMPPFPQLDRAETESVIAYVKELAGVPEGPPRPALSEPVARVGELLVKGTCHVCHDAAATPTTAFEYRVGYGNPPPLSFLTEQRTPPQVIRKVREGLIEPSVSASRGRMPVFEYLSAKEVTAAYIYLLMEPPARASAEVETPEHSPNPAVVSLKRR
jgi:mono/diheme cytochrome c family protein